MCNLYSITTNQAAISALFRVVNRYVGNLAPMPGVFPDYKAPVVRKPDTNGASLVVEKRFEFDHGRMSMSVLVRTPDGDVLCFCKGAAERVKGFCPVRLKATHMSMNLSPRESAPDAMSMIVGPPAPPPMAMPRRAIASSAAVSSGVAKSSMTIRPHWLGVQCFTAGL